MELKNRSRETRCTTYHSFFIIQQPRKKMKILFQYRKSTVATTMNYKRNQAKRLWNKQLKLRHEKQLVQMDLLAEDVQDHIDCLKRSAFSTRSRWDKYRAIGYFQTDEEIEIEFQPTVEYQIQYWFENQVELLLSDELTTVPEEEQDPRIQELTLHIRQLAEQMDDIMYSGGWQHIQDEEDDEYIEDKYDDLDEKVNNRILLF